MNNYYSEINNTNKLTEYNLKDLSSKISCENMSLLSKNYTDNQRTLFDANINMELCNSHHYYNDNIADIKGKENSLLSGMSIGKKVAYIKTPYIIKAIGNFNMVLAIILKIN